MDVLVEADLGREDETPAVGIVERPHQFVELVAPGFPRDEDAAVVGLADLNRGEDVPDRRPRELLDGLFRAISVRSLPVEFDGRCTQSRVSETCQYTILEDLEYDLVGEK